MVTKHWKKIVALFLAITVILAGAPGTIDLASAAPEDTAAGDAAATDTAAGDAANGDSKADAKKDEENIKKYLGLNAEQNLDYDFIFVDTDNIEGFNKFNLQEAQKNYFVTSFDLYSLKKGLEVLSNLQSVTSLTKVLFSEEALKENDDYLNFLSLGYKIVWSGYNIYFPIENGDLSVIYENQRVAKIKFKKLSIQYKDSLSEMAEEILGDVNSSSVRKAVKTIEKGA